VELGSFALWIELTKIEQEFERIVAYLEVVGISPFELRVLLGVVAIRFHQHLIVWRVVTSDRPTRLKETAH
jgi:hypothetical protein